MRDTFKMALALLAAGTLASLLPGCVERKLTIGSDPPGALVLVNDQVVGRTPVTVPFTWDGDYDLRFRLERNEGTPENPKYVHYYLHTHKKTTTPWFGVIGLDLFAELTPAQFKDEQVWAFSLPQVAQPTDEQLLQNATQLKQQLEPSRIPEKR